MAEEVIDVVWTDEAITSLDETVNYLLKEWTDKEVQKFFKYLDQFLSNVSRHPEMCRPSQRRKDIRLGVLNKHTRLVYMYKPVKKQISILLLWHFKRDPKKFKY